MKKSREQQDLEKLPQSVQEFIKLVIRKMGYRRKVRLEVCQELTAHFEDELRRCTDEQQKLQKAQQLIEEFGDVKLLGILLRRAKKRCRPFWRTTAARTFQTIGVLILSLTLYVAWFLSGKPAITTDYIAEVNRLARPVADESLNAAPLFEEAAAKCPNAPDGFADFWSIKYADANQAQRLAMENHVLQCSQALGLITEATERPYYWPKYTTGNKPDNDGSMIGVLLPHLNKFRELARALCLRAQINAEKGDYAQAFDNITTCYKFGEIVKRGEKTLIEQLVGIAIEALAAKNARELMHRYEIKPQQLEGFQSKFDEAYEGEDFTMRLLFEKLCVYDEIQRSFTEDRLGGGHLYLQRLHELASGSASGMPLVETVSSLEGLHILFTHPNKKETKETAERAYDFWQQVARKNPQQLRAEGIGLEKQIEQLVKGNVLLEMMSPAISKVHQLTYRIKADVEATSTIAAILRHQQNKGVLPTDLNELQQAGYVKQLPLDPFSNQPLVYKRTNDDFTLYSVGLNFIDDGGKRYLDKTGKVQLWADEGDAVFWPVQE